MVKLSSSQQGGASNSVLSALAGLRDPSRSGGNGCSALHRPDWSCWDRPAAHQPVSLFQTSSLCQTCVCSLKQESSKDREAVLRLRSSDWSWVWTTSSLFSSSQLPPGSLWSSSLVPAEDQLQRTHVHDSRHQSHLPVAAVGLRQSQVGTRQRRRQAQECCLLPGCFQLLGGLKPVPVCHYRPVFPLLLLQ